MYCPKCSQLEPSDQMRYCTRCGFPLHGVAILLSNDGAFPQLAAEQNPTPKPSRIGMMGKSLILTAVAWAIVLLATFWFDASGPFEVLAKASALLFTLVGLIGLIKFLQVFLFAKERTDQPAINAPQGGSVGTPLYGPNRGALPAQQSLPVSDYPRRANTREMAPRPSVTENTTKLLDDQTPTPSE